MTYMDISVMMRSGYKSDSRQLIVQHELENLTLAKFMDENDVNSTSVELTKLIDRVHQMTPQCPPNFLDNAHKLNYLRSAVKGLLWAKNSDSNCGISPFDLTRVCRDLSATSPLDWPAMYAIISGFFAL